MNEIIINCKKPLIDLNAHFSPNIKREILLSNVQQIIPFYSWHHYFQPTKAQTVKTANPWKHSQKCMGRSVSWTMYSRPNHSYWCRSLSPSLYKNKFGTFWYYKENGSLNLQMIAKRRGSKLEINQCRSKQSLWCMFSI